MNVLILGCGYTGTRLAHRLVQQGVAVQATNREGTAIAGLAIPIFPFTDQPRPKIHEFPPEALRGVTHVLSTIPPDSQGIDPVIAGLLPLLQAANLSWLGYLSTTGVYGDTQGAWVEETSPLNPQNPRSQQRVEAEWAFLNSTLPAHIFRLPGIYGPGRSIFDRLRAGTAVHIQRPGHVFSRIHVDDIVQTLVRSMQQPRPGSIYNVADDEPSEPSNLIVEGARLLGLPVPDPVPYAQAQLSPMAASFWQECRRVDNHKIKAELGVQLSFPSYREGLRAILAEEQAAGFKSVGV